MKLKKWISACAAAMGMMSLAALTPALADEAMVRGLVDKMYRK